MLYIVAVAVIVVVFGGCYLVTIFRCRREDIPDVVRAFASWFSKAAAPPELPPPEP